MNSSHARLFAACEFMIQLTLEDMPSTVTFSFQRVSYTQNMQRNPCYKYAKHSLEEARPRRNVVQINHQVMLDQKLSLTFPCMSMIYII